VELTIDESIELNPDHYLLFNGIRDNEGEYSKGIDDQGIPILKEDYEWKYDTVHEFEIEVDKYTYTRTIEKVPGKTWFYSFIDENDSGRLEAGEYFGVSEKNPHEIHSNNKYRIQILIKEQY
jgi:hypothetical protein